MSFSRSHSNTPSVTKILFEKEGPIAWIVFNDPERLNALTEEMGREIERLVSAINKDREVRIVIITGAGRAFSAGGNLAIIETRIKKKAAVNQKEMFGFYNRFLSLLKIEVPVIAMINGPAIGAAFALTLACDLRTASTNAKMGVNFVKLGISPGMGGTFLLPHVLGIPTAMDLLLTGRTLSAEEALQKGVVHHLYSPERLREETIRLAQSIAKNAPVAVRIAKKGIVGVHCITPLRKALRFESRGQAICFKTDDIKEGVAAIRSKRSPVFR